MRKLSATLFVLVVLAGQFACTGKCMKCNKSGSQTLRYCENDFTSSIEFNDQINALDSLGYDCFEK